MSVGKKEWAIDAEGYSVHLISPNWTFEQAQEYHNTYTQLNNLTKVVNAEYVEILEKKLAHAVNQRNYYIAEFTGGDVPFIIGHQDKELNKIGGGK